MIMESLTAAKTILWKIIFFMERHPMNGIMSTLPHQPVVFIRETITYFMVPQMGGSGIMDQT
jgi:hypothetical protein